jgi:hypothetical protein
MDDPDVPPPFPVAGDPLAAGSAPASVDAFRQVLSRHRRHQAVMLAAGLAVVAVVGSASGYAIGRQGGSGATQVAAGKQPSAPPSSGRTPPAAAPSVAAGEAKAFAQAAAGNAPWTQLLVRDSADGVRVRLYEQAVPAPQTGCAPTATCAAPPAIAACVPANLVETEVSDDQVAGDTVAPSWQSSGGGLDVLEAQVVGQGQPQPILVAVIHSAQDVAAVDLTTSYGTDTQAVPAGWAALAVQLPAGYQAASSDTDVPTGTLTARSASGAVVTSAPLGPQTGGMPAACQATAETCTRESIAPAPGVSSSPGGKPAEPSSAPNQQVQVICSTRSGTVVSGSGSGRASGSSGAASGSSGAAAGGGSGGDTSPPASTVAHP